MSVQTSYTNTTRPSRSNRAGLIKGIHTAFGKLELRNDVEQRNVYAALTGIRSLRAMSIKDLTRVESFLWAYHQQSSALKRPAVSDDEAQAWLD